MTPEGVRRRDPTAALSEKRGANQSEGTFDVAHDERRIDPNDAITDALERRVTARVSGCALAMICAVDFNHETLRGSQEVRDEATEQRHLTAKDHAQVTGANALP